MTSSPAPPAGPVDSCFVDRKAEERLDVDQLLTSLSHPRRREVLGLLDGEPEWTRADLAKRLAAMQESSSRPTKEEIETSLVHNHLPTLEHADLVSLDTEGWYISQGENYDLVRDMAEAASTVIDK